MPDDPRIIVKNINETLLGGTNELMVCFAQTPPPSKENIKNVNASEKLMPFLQSFFCGNPDDGINSKLNEMVPDQSKTVLILIPEFAISMANWARLDLMIRQLQRKVIVIGGLGVVQSSALKSWKEEHSDEHGATERSFGFPDNVVSGAGIIRYNAGCCWVHLLSTVTQSIIFLKNYLERTSESLITGLSQGSHLLLLNANDICIYPLICAEFTSQQESAKPLDRIKSHIDYVNSQGSSKNILVAGVSYEPDSSHHLWRQGIKESVHLNHNLVTAIVNNALDPCYPDENKDKWRCLTGVFSARRDAREQTAQPPTRSLTGDHDVIGVVCRTGDPQVICGEISWD